MKIVRTHTASRERERAVHRGMGQRERGNRSLTAATLCGVTVLLASVWIAAVGADGASGPAGASLDELLGIDKPTQSASPDDAAGSMLAGEPGPMDLMQRAVTRMTDAAARLERDASLPADLATQRLQREAIDSLDALIAQLNRPRPQRDRSGGAGAGQPGQADTGSRQNVSPSAGAATAVTAGSEAHHGEASPGSVATAGLAGALEQTDASGRAWGHLPAQIRGELSQGSSDPFSAVYQPLTEAYYQRLAQPLEDDAEPVR